MRKQLMSSLLRMILRIRPSKSITVMPDYKKPVDDLADDLKKYVDLRVDDLKLKMVRGLSLSIARVLTSLALIMLLGFAVLTLIFAVVLLIGSATGHYALGAIIAAGILLLASLVVFLLRKKLFTDGLVRMFVQIFFPDEDEE